MVKGEVDAIFLLNLSTDGEAVGADQHTWTRNQPINLWAVLATEVACGHLIVSHHAQRVVGRSAGALIGEAARVLCAVLADVHTRPNDQTSHFETAPAGWTEEAWNKGNLSGVEEIYAARYVGHDPARPIGDTRGPEGAKQFVATYRRASPDTHITIEDMVADGDTVVNRFTARGIHNGALLGLAPTDKQVTVTGIGMSRFGGGKIVEEWTNYDALGMLQQLGAVPQMAPAGV